MIMWAGDLSLLRVLFSGTSGADFLGMDFDLPGVGLFMVFVPADSVFF